MSQFPSCSIFIMPPNKLCLPPFNYLSAPIDILLIQHACHQYYSTAQKITTSADQLALMIFLPVELTQEKATLLVAVDSYPYRPWYLLAASKHTHVWYTCKIYLHILQIRMHHERVSAWVIGRGTARKTLKSAPPKRACVRAWVMEQTLFRVHAKGVCVWRTVPPSVQYLFAPSQTGRAISTDSATVHRTLRVNPTPPHCTFTNQPCMHA